MIILYYNSRVIHHVSYTFRFRILGETQIGENTKDCYISSGSVGVTSGLTGKVVRLFGASLDTWDFNAVA